MNRIAAKSIDLMLAHTVPVWRSRSHHLVVLAFHSVLPGIAALEADLLDPYQPLTIDDVAAVVRHLRHRGYQFVTGRDVDAKAIVGPAAWLTFDDGYANNLAIQPVLQRLDAKATIFVSSGNVASGEAYWWDIVHRESRRRGVPASDIAGRREQMKRLSPAAIRSMIITEFGAPALRPETDLDRPMSAQELAALSRDPRVEIGNHTHDHAILTVGDAASVQVEIRRCQDDLRRITGHAPVSIAYPNGDFSQPIVLEARAQGLRIGVTCLPCRNDLGRLIDPADRMTIGRASSVRHGRISRELSLAMAPVGLTMAAAERSRKSILGR